MISDQDESLFKKAHERILSEITLAEKQLEELRVQLFALKKAEVGLGILTGYYEAEYHAQDKKFSWAKK